MKLQCPECRKVLPSIGRDVARPGDTVQCGLCLHVWRISTACRPLTSLLETGGRAQSKDAAAGALSPDELKLAKSYLARSVAAGLTSVTPPPTPAERRALEAFKGAAPTQRVYKVPERFKEYLKDFLSATAAPFTCNDLRDWLMDHSVFYAHVTLNIYLPQLCVIGLLAAAGYRGKEKLYRVKSDESDHAAGRATISVPEKDTATRQLASCNGASIPARTISMADAMLRHAITGFCFLLSAFCFHP
jgi:hypothetical protein